MSKRAEVVIHNHPRAHGEVHTWHIEKDGKRLVEDTTHRSAVLGICKRRQIAGAFGRLVVEAPKGYRWELACPFDPRDVAARAPRFFRTRREALEALVVAALAVDEAVS